jgi:tetratricopeptide (TPR) repeat protein
MCRYRGAVAAAIQPVIAEDTGVCTNGMADEAVAVCTRIHALNRSDALAHNNRGLASLRKGDYARAIADADQAIELNPKYTAAYATRGEAYEANNDPNHAIADFDQALKLDPSLADAQRGVQALLAKRSNLGAQTNAPTQYASGDCHVLI